MLTGQSIAYKFASHILRWIDIRQHIKKTVLSSLQLGEFCQQIIEI